MHEPQVDTSERDASRTTVFVSYATADRKQALSVCKALESRATECWISTRDVAPGENYQEAIVRSLRSARAMVLVFSDAANNSDEIKKELSLASRYHVPVLALRIEDVEPSDAFAYELSTRQWIDAFDGWDRSIDALAGRLDQLPGQTVPQAAKTSDKRAKLAFSRPALIVAAAAALLVLVGAAWWLLRPAPTAAHSMMVRLTGYQRLSAELPATLPDAARDEIIAAFGDQGVVGVSTASAPAPGPAPAYALGGTIRRHGDQIRVITRLTNERSGVTLWSESFDYDGTQVPRVPRRIAVDSGNVLRCGLFGASTYPKPLPDPVLADYMQFCQRWMEHQDAGKALESARRVTAAASDFSWGWSAVTSAVGMALYSERPSAASEPLRKEGLEAADRALALDPSNSEALAQRALLLDRRDLTGQEKLFGQALAARPLSCGCEHIAYALFLQNVGRFTAAAEQAAHGVDMLALDSVSQFILGDSLLATGRADEAKPHLDAFIELERDPATASWVAMTEAPQSGDYAAGIKALADSRLQMPAQRRSALLAGFRAMATGDASAKTAAIKQLLALPSDQGDDLALMLLAALGANQEAFDLFMKGFDSRYDWPSLLWYPSMRGVLQDARFPALAERLGLMKYWRTSGNRPDVCSTKTPPAFCRMI